MLIEAILRADWPAPCCVSALTTLRHGAGASVAPFDQFNLGMRCGDDPQVVARNRHALVSGLGLPAPPCWLRQVHGSTVVRLEAQLSPWPGATAHVEHHRHAAVSERLEPEADAAVTSTPGRVLGILTADCLPVVLAARDGREVAAAHAGWRGLAGGVLGATVGVMRTPTRDLLAWLGPAAGPHAYEVGQDVLEAFTGSDPGAATALRATRPGHWHINLYALAHRQLAAMGVSRVYGGTRCTISEPAAFFSHRRDQRTGRMATLVWIEPTSLAHRCVSQRG